MEALGMRIPIADPDIGEEELANVITAVRSGWISSAGEFIIRFEQQFAQYCGAKYGVATSSGTAAIHLALAALGIGKEDEVIVPTLTFIATANAVTFTGASPVFVDSHPEYWCMDPNRIEERITKRTKAIIPVHLYGHPCDMSAISDIAKSYNLLIIEDAAEAHGAEYKHQKVGSFGDVSCFSFYGNKIITTGEGGMCLTDNEELATRLRKLRDHGKNSARAYWHDVIGFNYRMTNLQAAVGVAQIDKLDRLIQKKRAIGALYEEALGDLVQQGVIKLYHEMPWSKSVWWMYSILIEDSFGKDRNEVAEELLNREIATRPVFYPIHTMPPYYNHQTFPVSEEISRKGLTLPSGLTLSNDDITTICSLITSMSQTR